ncbi:hypothetical protein F5B21DRAFT_95759 [Xylaria acuta]|nr:hypothetical protein F5B21DRAFT_95759 [Xylaria acuta]
MSVFCHSSLNSSVYPPEYIADIFDNLQLLRRCVCCAVIPGRDDTLVRQNPRSNPPTQLIFNPLPHRLAIVESPLPSEPRPPPTHKLQRSLNMAENGGTADHDTTTFGRPPTPIGHSATTIRSDPLVAPGLSTVGLFGIVAGGLLVGFLIFWCLLIYYRRRRQQFEQEVPGALGHNGVNGYRLEDINL